MSLWLLNSISLSAAEPSELDLVLDLVLSQDDTSLQLDLLKGLKAGLAGQRDLSRPGRWPEAYDRLSRSDNEELRELVEQLAVVFGHAPAIERLRQAVLDNALSLDRRRRALQTLVDHPDDSVGPLLLELLDLPLLRRDALQSLARLDQPGAAERIIERFGDWNEAEQSDAVQTLATRPTAALQLLDAMQHQRIPRQAVTAFTARQLSDLGDPVATRLREVWGEVRPASADKRAEMERYRKLLSEERLSAADPGRGRIVFERTCQKCHRLFGVGESIGPDLTGTNRVSLAYLLENLVDPNALVGRDYQLQIFVLDDGRVISGLVVAEDAQSVTVQTQNQQMVIPRGAIDDRELSPLSMMPENQLNDLTIDEIADLIAYLQSPVQVEP